MFLRYNGTPRPPPSFKFAAGTGTTAVGNDFPQQLLLCATSKAATNKR